jgi:hypothetical protein
VPRARVEITERLVLHLIEFGEQLGNEAIRAAVIGEEIVPDAVPSRPPQDPVAVLLKKSHAVCICAQSRSSNAVWKCLFEPVSTRLIV